MLAEFSAGAGHELNNPLGAISGRVQLLLLSETDSAKRAELASILNQVKRAQDMIADLRLVAAPPKPNFSSFSLKEAFESLQKDFRETFEERKITWNVRGLSDSNNDWTADSVLFQILLRALLRNSLRAIHASGEILLRISFSGAGLELRFSDTGEGIPEENRPLIFDPFYSSYQSGRGLGFGLTKARIIAELHGGTLDFDPTDTERTTFVLRLPKHV